MDGTPDFEEGNPAAKPMAVCPATLAAIVPVVLSSGVGVGCDWLLSGLDCLVSECHNHWVKKFTSKSRPRSTPPDIHRIRAVQERRMEKLVGAYLQQAGAEAEAQWHQGRLIAAEVAAYETEEDAIHSSLAGGNAKIARCQYGDARIDSIANHLGVHRGTVQNRRYFSLALPRFETFDRRLSPSHYTLVERFVQADKLKREAARKLLASAAVDNPPWSVRRLSDELLKMCPPADLVNRRDEPIEKLRHRLASSMRSASELLDIVLGHPRAGEIILDGEYEQFMDLFLMYRAMVDTLQRQKGSEVAFPDSSRLASIRPIRRMPGASYVGSKRKEVLWTLQQMQDLLPWNGIVTACDLFAGRCHIGHAMKQAGLQVTVNDHQRWLAAWGRWVVENDQPVLMESDVKLLLRAPPPGAQIDTFIEDGFHFQHRGRLEAITLDNARICQRYLANVPRLPEPKQELARCLLAAVLYERLPFGREKHARPRANEFVLRDALLTALHEANSYVCAGTKSCKATQDDAVEHLRHNSYDLLYLDPPYAGRGATYNYRLPESIMAGHMVDAAPPVFGTSNKAKAAMRAIFQVADAAAPYWIVAYNSTSDLPPDEIGRLISPFRATTFVAVGHRMSVGSDQQSRERKGDTSELLIVCRPYPAWIADKRIVSQVREMDHENSEADVSHLLPGAFARPHEIKRLKNGCYSFRLVSYSAKKKGRRLLAVQCLDDLGPDCHKVTDALARMVFGKGERGPDGRTDGR
jgi:hypothetical protein